MDSESKDGEITKKPITISGTTILPRYYNATATAGTVVPGTVAGTIGSETLTVTGLGSVYSGSNVGTYSSTITYTVANGTGLASNYTSLDSESKDGEITKKPLTPSITAHDKCYDGNNLATLHTQTLATIIGTEDVSLIVGSAAFASPASGSQTVTASGLSLSGAGVGNYSLTTTTATAQATIYALPIANAIIGSHDVVMSNSLNLTSNATGVDALSYVWHSTLSGVASVDNTGVVTPVSVGTTQVSYTVTDGNPTHCSATSPDFAVNVTGKIWGYVTYDNTYSTPLNNVLVTLKNSGGTPIATYTTGPNFGDLGQSGYFEFTNNLSAGNYTISATSTSAYGGYNATDALIVQRRAINSSYSLSPLRILACDVNLSNTITALDALYIKLRTVGTINYFPAGNWVFETSTFSLTGNSNVPIKGACYGDVNGSFVPMGGYKATDAYLPTLTDGTTQIQKGTSFIYDVKSEAISNLGAMTIEMDFDNNLFAIEKLSSAFENLNYEIRNGKILIAWADFNSKTIKENETLFSLQIKAKELLPSETQIFSIVNSTEFADDNADVLNNVRLKLANVITANSAGFDVTAYPNPFSSVSNISYTLPENSSVKITLKNLLGQSIATISDETKVAGFYNVEINANDLNLTGGVYFYTIEVKGTTASYARTYKLVLEK